jgi:hypothetical protein
MNTRQRFGIAAVSAAVSVLAAPSLPEELVTRWNAAAGIEPVIRSCENTYRCRIEMG